MRKLVTVLLAISWSMMMAQVAGAQQVVRASQRSLTAKAQPSRIADPRDRNIQRTQGQLLAATTPASDRSANLNLIVTPEQEFYPDSTLRAPLVTIGQDGEAGLLGRPYADVYRTSPFRSVFPLDDADASARIGVYVQANF